jgi:hypothetical protein
MQNRLYLSSDEKRGSGHEAKPNWEKFACSLGSTLETPHTKELKEAIQYILKNPPKKQIVVNNIIDWNTIEPNHNSQADLILLYVRRVRNNLFHGGKFHGHWVAPVRDYDLLRHSMTILEACLAASDDVREAYEG